MRIRWTTMGSLILILSVGACSANSTSSEEVDDADTLALNDVNDYVYWLQGIDLGVLGESAYDLVVMDYASDGAEENEFTSAEITALKTSSGGDKIVLAYMSIGEAEDYRFYWQEDFEEDNPSFIGPENPDFAGNYKARFWESDWQDIIFEYLDRIAAAGFDGVYLDIIDAYSFWGPEEIDGNGERPTAAEDMVAFVEAIAERARATDSNFFIFPQNASEIIDEGDDLEDRYFAVIDGIGAEDTFFPGDDADDSALNIQEDVVALLGRYVDAGKLVIAIDYVLDSDRIDTFYGLATDEGFIPYASDRDLGSLTINAGYEPD